MNRKQLIRQYKETPRPMGVKLGSHQNRDLQRDWNALGAEAFAFEVLDTLAPRDEARGDYTRELAALEELWLEKLSAVEDLGYTRRRSALAGGTA